MIADILKVLISKDNYESFKSEENLNKAFHPFELPGAGVFTAAGVLKAFYSEHSLCQTKPLTHTKMLKKSL